MQHNFTHNLNNFMRLAFRFLSFLSIATLNSMKSTAIAKTLGSLPQVHELVYFDGAGRAEPVRILLHAAGIDFIDTRFKGPEWPTVKPTTPLGSVPVLKIGDTSHCQSVALMRYAAKQAGLYPEDPLDALKVDEVVDSLNELMGKAPRSSDEEEKKLLREQFEATTMKQYADFIESLIKENGGCWVAGSGISMADLAIAAQVQSIQSGMWDNINPKFFDKYPCIIRTAKAAFEDEVVTNYYAFKKEQVPEL